MSGIQKFFISRKIRKALALPIKQPMLQRFSDMRSITLLTCVSQQAIQKTIRWMVQDFEAEKEIFILNFILEKTVFQYDYHKIKLRCFSPHAFSRFGTPDEHIAELIRQSTSDLLINTCQSKNLYLDWVAVLNESLIKSCIQAEANSHIYSLQIYDSQPLSIQDSLLQCRSYLNALGGK